MVIAPLAEVEEGERLALGVLEGDLKAPACN